MGNSKSSRSTKKNVEPTGNFLLPSPSVNSLASLWEVDTDFESDNPNSEISLRPVQRSQELLPGMDKDGENSKSRSKSLKSLPSESSLTRSQEPESLSRVHTAEEDLQRKTQKKSSKSKKDEKKKKKKKDKGAEKDPKQPKKPLAHSIRRKLSFKERKDKGKSKEKRRSEHGVLVNSDNVESYKESNDVDSEGRVRTSHHITAELKKEDEKIAEDDFRSSESIAGVFEKARKATQQLA
ncbi:hypothetical protein ABW20_dc0104138 [Dactylellina cionopaga]|nr:hypothetical protein ABW20_dc0104138 [Dactylellina cionopaga]